MIIDDQYAPRPAIADGDSRRSRFPRADTI
jgi:hypothetical protein